MPDLNILIQLLMAAAAGALVALLLFPVLLAYRKDEKARRLRALVKGTVALSRVNEDSDPVAAAKRAAEEKALLEQFRAAVADLKAD